MATKIKRIFQKGSLFNITNETTGQPVTEASLVSIGDILDILTMDADKVPHIYGECAEVISVSGFNTKIKVKDETNFILGYKDKNKSLPYLKITNNANVDLYKADGTKITDTTELYVNDVIKVKPNDETYFAGADVEALGDNSYITWVNPPEEDSSEECTFRANVQEITLIDKEVERLQRFTVSSDFESQADIHCVHLRYNKEIPVGTIYTMLCKGDRFQLTFKEGFYVDMTDADKGFELEDAENHIYKATRIGRVYIDIKFKGKNVTLKIPNTTKCKVIKIDSEEVIPNDTVMKTGDKFRVIMTDARYYLKIPDNTTMNESGPWKYDELDGQRYFVCQIKNVPIDTVTIPDMPEKPTLNLDMREPADRDKIKSVTSIYGPTTSTLPSNIFHAGEPFKVELKDEYKNDYILIAKNERGFTIPSDDSTNFKIDLRYDPQIVLKLESNTTKVKITNIRDGSDLVNGSILKRGDKFTVELPIFKKYINITFSDSIGVYHTYSSTKVTYIVKDDATKAEIKIEEAPIAHFDNKAHDLIKIFAMERTPQVEITTFPDDILHVGEQFRIVWKNPSDFIKYEIVYTNIEKTGEVAYKPTAVGAIMDTIPMLHFTVVGYWSDIEFFNETTGKAISNMEQVHKGDIIKITLPHKYGTITPNEDLEVLSDTELVKRYKIKDTSSATPTVTLEETPKAHFNNLSPEILYVKAIDRTPAELITTFPEDILYVGENIEIGFKDSANESKYIIKPTTHLELVEGKKYKIKSAGGGVEAKKKAILHIIKSSATSTEEECTVINYYDMSITYHDGDTVCYGDLLRINLNETGYELDSDKIKDLQENSGYFIVNGDNPTIATKLKAGNLHIDQQGRELCHVYKEDQVTELHESDSIYKGDIIYVVRVKEQYKITSSSGLEEQSGSAGLSHKFKITDVQNTYVSLNDEGYITIDSDHPELIQVIDVMTNEVLTLPDSTTYNFSSLSHAIKVYLKEGLNPSYYTITVTGANEYGPNQYRFNEPLEENVLINVEIAKATLNIVSHETPSEIKVTNITGDTEYHTGDELEIGTKIKVIPNSSYVVDKSKLVDLEAVDEANNIYKITGLNPKVEAVVSTTPSTFHIKGDKDGVTVKKHPSQQEVHDGDVLTVGEKLSIVKVNGFKLTDLEGLASTDPVNNIYTVTGTESSITCTINPVVTIYNSTPDRIEIKNHLGVSLTSYPDSTTLHQGEDITIDFKPPYNDTDYEIKFSGLEHKSGSNYQVKEDATEVKVYVSWKSIQLTITGKASAINVQSNGNLIGNDYIFTAGDKFVVTRSNTFVTYTVTGADKFTSAEDTELKQNYIVREDATAVVINVDEAQLVDIDCDTPDIISIKTVDPPIVTINSFPNSDILHHNQDFLVEWKDPDYENHYKIKTTVQHKSGMLYTVNQFAPFSVDAKHKAKIHILDKEHTNVTNMSNEPIYDNDYSLAIGDRLKIQRPPYSYEYRVKSVVGAVQKLGYLYEITDENVTIEVEPVPFVTINNDNPDIIAVSYYWNSVRNNIDTFPCSDKIHQTQEIVIEYRDEDLYKPLYDINVTGATATPSEHRYRVGTTDVNISAVMKVVPSHIKIKHAANVTVIAESDGRELHDGDTSISTTEIIKIVPKKFFKINPALLKGLKATADPNKFTIVATEVEVDVEEEPTVILYNNKDSLLRILVQDNEVTTFPSNLLHNEEIFKVLFRVTSLKDKYDMKVTGAELQASILDGYSYKVSGPVVTIDCEHKKIPATIHISDETHVEVKTVENAVIHDGDTSLFVGDKIKIIPKPGYKIKEPLVGLLKEGKEYKLIDADVTIEVEPRPYVTINNEAEALVKVSTSAEPPVEIVTFPSTADIREGETFQVEFRNATDENKYNIIVDGAMKLSDKRYQAVSSPITIKTKDRPKVDPYLIKLRRSQGFGVRYIKWSRKGKLVHENSFF